MSDVEARLSTLHEYLVKNGLKKTHQRDIIARIFFSPPYKHYRIEELLELSRKEDATISYATVYRTLMMFVEAGIAAQRHFGKGQSQFELITDDHHDHLICTECGAIVEFENDDIENLQKEVAENHGFVLTNHKMELYGLCSRCKRIS